LIRSSLLTNADVAADGTISVSGVNPKMSLPCDAAGFASDDDLHRARDVPADAGGGRRPQRGGGDHVRTRQRGVERGHERGVPRLDHRVRHLGDVLLHTVDVVVFALLLGDLDGEALLVHDDDLRLAAEPCARGISPRSCTDGATPPEYSGRDSS
jgi:hypothetical protein